MPLLVPALRRLGGVAETRELRARGIRPAQFSAAVASGDVIRVRRGWYAVSPPSALRSRRPDPRCIRCPILLHNVRSSASVPCAIRGRTERMPRAPTRGIRLPLPIREGRYPFVDPARSPRTKYRWRLKNTMSGMIKEMNADAVRRCHS